MHTSRLMIAGAVLAAMAVTGCKTTEQNYRAAYEVAREKFDNDGGLDSTIYNRLRPQGRGAQLAVGSDTLTMHTLAIGFPEDGGATRENVKTYCVVVAQFKQIFNAKAMRQRLIEAGYPDAVVVNTREPLYYVLAGSMSSPEGAKALIDELKADDSVVLRAPFPWVLRPGHLAR